MTLSILSSCFKNCRNLTKRRTTVLDPVDGFIFNSCIAASQIAFSILHSEVITWIMSSTKLLGRFWVRWSRIWPSKWILIYLEVKTAVVVYVVSVHFPRISFQIKWNPSLEGFLGPWWGIWYRKRSLDYLVLRTACRLTSYSTASLQISKQ